MKFENLSVVCVAACCTVAATVDVTVLCVAACLKILHLV